MAESKDTGNNLHEVMFYKKLDDKVQCETCNRFCIIKPNDYGDCKVRRNLDGKLYLLVYGKLAATEIDSIEKKPLFNFKPKSKVYSIATVGCNYHCKFCQNWQMSQSFLAQVPYKDYTPEEVVAEAKSSGSQGIAYTYTEPTIFFEFALDTMKLAKKEGLYNVWVSNGYMSEKVAKEILPYLDAVNFDLKGTDIFYKKLVGIPTNKPVIDNIKFFYKNKVHVEVTNLIITAENDSDAAIDFIIKTIKEISDEIPLHFIAYYPSYKMMNPPTQPLTLIRARNKALAAGLKYVYIGNVLVDKGENTVCPNCHTTVVERTNFFNVQNHLKDGKCPKCKKKLPNFVP